MLLKTGRRGVWCARGGRGGAGWAFEGGLMALAHVLSTVPVAQALDFLFCQLLGSVLQGLPDKEVCAPTPLSTNNLWIRIEFYSAPHPSAVVVKVHYAGSAPSSS